MNMRRITAGLAAATVTFSLAACGGSDSDSDSKGSMLVSSGTLTVCSDVPYAPFEDFDKSSDIGFKGFDIDIVNTIAQGLDLKLKVIDTDFDALQSAQALNAKQCDLGASAMTITPDREKNILFSEPYYDSLQSLLVPEGSDITSIKDLTGKKVGVQRGTTGKTYAEENAKGASIVTLPSDAELFQAIKGDQVDALLQDLPVNVVHERAGGYTVVEEFDTNESYGLAIRKDNTELQTKVNEQLKAMKDDGTYQKLYDTYFSAK